MKQAITAVLTATAMLAAGKPATAQQSGMIEYEVTSRVDISQMRVVTMTPGGGRVEGAPEGAMPDLPNLITMKQILSFSGGKGKIETEGGGGPRIMMSASGPGGGNVVRGTTVSDAGGSGNFAMAAPGRPVANTLRPPVSNTTYIDLENRKYLSVIEERKDSVVENVWYSEEDYKQTPEFKTSGKTKKIAGYSCKRATAVQGDEQFVIWYTTEIPVTFSPVNGVLPEKGVVLSIESSKRSYLAKKIELKPIPEADVSLPTTARKLTAEELKEKRRSIMERWHNEQFKKMQEQIQ